MAQTLAGITISVDSEGFTINGEANYAFQDVLDAIAEVIDFFGAKSDRIQLAFWLDEDRNSNIGLSTLRTAYKTDASVNLTMHEGSWGNWRIITFSAVRVHATNHTGLVWRCQAELVAA